MRKSQRLTLSAVTAGLTVLLVGGVLAAPSVGATTNALTQLVKNPGFESGATDWTSSSGVIGQWGSSGEAAHSGTWDAWLNGYGSSHTDSLSQSVSIPAGGTASLSFWLHVDTAETTTSVAYDKLTVQVGSATLATYSNLNKNSGYAQKSFDVSSYAGQTVTLKFTGVEDSSLQTSFVIDDVALDASGSTPSPTPTSPSPTPTSPPPTGPERTPAKLAYTVNLTSDSTGANWSGTEKIDFTNVSATPLNEVYLRLWDNYHGSCPTTQPIKISNVTGGTAGSLEVGCTALKITLTTPLDQNQSGSVSFNLAIAVPSGSDRFGRNGSYNYLGNALPLAAIRDSAGWHLDPYTNNGESFYSLAADFSVTLDHPTSLLTPSSGTTTETPGSSGRTVTTATASKVRDFAWAAGPFSHSGTTSTSGVKVDTYWTSGVSSGSAASIQDASSKALDAHGPRFGAFPYTQQDVIVDNTFWFGGMEYPGFVLDTPSSTAAVHELAHQWWYGIVGDDEYRAPWLDESFADYATDLYFGRTGSGCGITWESSAEKLTNSMAYWDQHSSRYGTVVYGYGKCALHDLRRILGDSTMANLLTEYAQAHWYGVSTTAEFKAAAQAKANALPTPVDLTSFWSSHRIEG